MSTDRALALSLLAESMRSAATQLDALGESRLAHYARRGSARLADEAKAVDVVEDTPPAPVVDLVRKARTRAARRRGPNLDDAA